MINTDKHQGHTKGDNEVGWRIVGDNFVMNDKSPTTRYIAYVQLNNDGEHTIVGFSDADANLIADAPLFLAEVEQLQSDLRDCHNLLNDCGFFYEGGTWVDGDNREEE